MSTSKNDLLVKNLIEFGFSEKEAKIYITLLALEIATANEIAKAANINRSSTYVVLEGLKNKGFVGLSNDKKVQGYVAVSPDIILETLESNIKKQNILKEKIKNIIPDLKGLDKNNKKAPIVRVFEGKSGIREAYFNIFDTDFKEFRVCEDVGKIVKIFPDFLDYDLKHRISKNISILSIGPASKDTMSICFQGPDDPLCQHAFIPENNFKFPVDITIYGNRLAFVSPKDTTGIIIEHEEVAQSLRYLFDLAWEEAKRIRVNKELVYRNPDNKTPTKKSKGKK